MCSYLDVTGVDMGRLGEDALAAAASDILDSRGSEVGATAAWMLTAGDNDSLAPPGFLIDGLPVTAGAPGEWIAASKSLYR